MQSMQSMRYSTPPPKRGPVVHCFTLVDMGMHSRGPAVHCFTLVDMGMHSSTRAKQLCMVCKVCVECLGMQSMHPLTLV